MKSRDKIIKISRNNINKLHNLINKSNNTEHNSINNLLIFEKKDTVNFPNIYSNLNILAPSQKRNIDGEKLININMRKINKLYISNNSKSKFAEKYTELYNITTNNSRSKKREKNNSVSYLLNNLKNMNYAFNYRQSLNNHITSKDI